MSLLAIPMIAILALFLVLLITPLLLIYIKKIKNKVVILDAKMQSTFLLVDELQAVNNQLQQDLDNIIQNNEKLVVQNEDISKNLEHQIQALQHQALEQKKMLTQLQVNEGQDKFYTRAFKLAEKGADIDEIIKECELPRAEVEMLLAVYRQRTRSN